MTVRVPHGSGERSRSNPPAASRLRATTADELIASAGWRRRHSLYLLWAIPFLGFVALLYTGVRARRRDWIAWGIAYGLVIIAFVALAPEDPDSLLAAFAIDIVVVAAWVGSIVHLLTERKSWLRWKAEQQAGPVPVAETAAVSAYPPPPPPARFGRRRVLLVLGIAVAIVLGVGTFAVVTDVVFTNDLLDAEFRDGSDPFVTGENDDYVIDLVDGTYRIRSRTGSESPARSFARFPRRAYLVDMSADVVSVSGESQFGIGCWHSTRNDGYVLIARSGGGVSISRTDETESGWEGRRLATNEDVVVPTQNVSLMLSCRTALVGSSVTVIGFVDGQEVISVTDPDGYDGFEAGVLVFQSDTKEADARFSRAKAIVTGSDE